MLSTTAKIAEGFHASKWEQGELRRWNSIYQPTPTAQEPMACALLQNICFLRMLHRIVAPHTISAGLSDRFGFAKVAALYRVTVSRVRGDTEWRPLRGMVTDGSRLA